IRRRALPPPLRLRWEAPLLGRWRDISIHSEQVFGVVLRLDFGQAGEVLPVRGTDSLLTLVRGLEVDVMSASGERAQAFPRAADPGDMPLARDRKSTRLNSSHVSISYAVFCLKKKKK